MDKKSKRPLGILSFLLPSVPIILIVGYFIISAVSAAVGEGWVVFYGALFLLAGLAILTPTCGCAGLVCSILAVYKYGVQTKRIFAVILNCLLLILSVPLILSFISNA